MRDFRPVYRSIESSIMFQICSRVSSPKNEGFLKYRWKLSRHSTVTCDQIINNSITFKESKVFSKKTKWSYSMFYSKIIAVVESWVKITKFYRSGRKKVTSSQKCRCSFKSAYARLPTVFREFSFPLNRVL